MFVHFPSDTLDLWLRHGYPGLRTNLFRTHALGCTGNVHHHGAVFYALPLVRVDSACDIIDHSLSTIRLDVH